ncbi:MAG: arylesterase [Blastocatellia bacterium]
MPFWKKKFKSGPGGWPLVERSRRGVLRLPPVLFLILWVAIGLSAACRSEKDASSSTKRAEGEAVTPTPEDPRPVILAFGDSLTAGYGLAPAEAYPALLQRRLDERGYRYRVVNAGVSGETTAGGLRRLEWSLAERVELVILALGANDGLRGQPVPEMRQNLTQMIELIQKRSARPILAGMEAPPNLGPEYTQAFRAVYPELARRYRLPLIPFLLEGVAGLPEFNQADGIHPNVAGELRVLENVWRVLEPLLGPAST